jgi:hypothetical protein
MLPEIPVTVTVIVLGVAVVLTVTVSVLVDVVLVGLNDAVTPFGSPEADNPMLPPNPW